MQRPYQPVVSKDALHFPQVAPLPQTKDHSVLPPSHRCDKYYELKNTLSNRAAALGYGHKYDFTKELPKSPPPNSYHFGDSFSPSPKKGFSFG